MNEDVVNKPAHYTNGNIECIDAITCAVDGYTGVSAFCAANVIKYLWRSKRKNGMEDLYKARWYLNRLIVEEFNHEKRTGSVPDAAER